MKRLRVLAVVVLLIIATTPFAGAAPTLSFDIDFEQDGIFERICSDLVPI